MLKHTFLVISIFTFLQACQSNSPQILNLERKKINELYYMHQATFIDDLNNNHYSELVFIDTDPTDLKLFENKIQIVDLYTNAHLDSENIWAELKDVGACDFNNDGKKEIIYIYEDNDSLFLKVYDLFSSELAHKRYLLDEFFLKVQKLNVNDYWNGSCKIAKFQDLNNDGFCDVIIKVQAMYEKLPRGLIAYDIKNNKRMWYYPTGTVVTEVEVIDLNNDGLKEIIFSTVAPGNGAFNNGTDDLHSYIIIINAYGKKVFQQQMAGENSATVATLDYFTSKFTKDLITLTSSDNYYDDTGNIIIWEWDDDLNFTRRKENNKLPLKRFFNVINNSKSPSILSVSKNHKLCKIDTNLIIVDTLDYELDFVSILGAYDLDNDGGNEYIFNLKNGEISIYDHNIQLKSLSKINGKFQKIKRGKYFSDGYAILENNGTISEISFTKSPIYNGLSKEPLAELLILLMIFNIIFVVFFFRTKSNWQWYRNQISIIENLSCAVFVLDVNGNIVSANKKAERLLKISNKIIINSKASELLSDMNSEIGSWVEEKIKLKESSSSQIVLKNNCTEQKLKIQIQFVYSRRRKLEGIFITVDDISHLLHSKKTAGWIAVAQKLAHEIKNPLTTIRLSLQRIQMEYENNPELKRNFEELIEDSLKEASRVRKVVDDFMHFSRVETDRPALIDLREIVHELKNKYLLTIPDKIVFHVNIDKTLPKINVVKSQIYTVLTNLIDNAVEAIKIKGEINIKVGKEEILENPLFLGFTELATIEISDTGSGIEQNVLNKIFQPFYTTKDGGSGLGLIIVKKIIEDHNGTVEIHSKKRLGTNVIIKLPINNNNNNLE